MGVQARIRRERYVTIVQAMFRGFPWRKVPQYIISENLGAYIACLCTYLTYKDPILVRAVSADVKV